MAQPCLRERIRSGLPVWSFAFLPVVVRVGVGYYRFLRHLPPAVGRWFLISAAVYQGGALGVEMIESLITANALPRLVIKVSQGVEESLEIAGISYFVCSLLRLLADPVLGHGTGPHSARGEVRAVLRALVAAAPLSSATDMATAFSDEWADAWGTTLAASPEYRQVAAAWEGSVAAVAGDEPHAPAVFLDLWHGDCRAARAATAADLASATYLLQAAPTAWRDLLEGRLAPVMALLTGRIQIARGDLATLLPYTAAAKELLRLAGTIPTEFPPDW